MNYFLILHAYPPIIVFNDTIDIYYKAIGYYDKTEDISQFVDYLKVSLEQTWEMKRAQVHNLQDILER